MSPKKPKAKACKKYKDALVLDAVLISLFRSADGELEDGPILMFACRTLERLGLAGIRCIKTINETAIKNYYVCSAGSELRESYDQGLMEGQVDWG